MKNAVHIGQSAGFTQQIMQSSYFDHMVFLKKTEQSQTLIIYIEGDGSAWRDRYTPSQDPTPHNPIGLKLATLDPQPLVAYVARVGQFTGGSAARACDGVAYWTSHRFSEEVINSTNAIIDQLVQVTGAKSVALVGYSGGGAVALLVATKRTDVVAIRTVAGNIDHKAWTDFHHISPLDASLNAADVAQELCSIPQVHYVGEYDAVMPIGIAHAYHAFMDTTCVSKIECISGCSHSEGWAELWQSLCTHYYHTLSMP